MKEIGRLHVISDQRESLVEAARSIVAAGVPVFQLRVKDRTDRQRYELARRMAEVCDGTDTRLIINDRCDLAVAVGAAGVHVGADDLPVAAARRLLGPDLVVGATARDPEAARRAEHDGADYLGVGPAYPTGTKQGLPQPLGPERIGEIVAAVSIPVIAVGGITPDRIPELLAVGVHGVAVVSAVWAQPDPAAAVGRLLEALGGGR